MTRPALDDEPAAAAEADAGTQVAAPQIDTVTPIDTAPQADTLSQIGTGPQADTVPTAAAAGVSPTGQQTLPAATAVPHLTGSQLAAGPVQAVVAPAPARAIPTSTAPARRRMPADR